MMYTMDLVSLGQTAGKPVEKSCMTGSIQVKTLNQITKYLGLT